MATIRVARPIAADPSSTALLLAGPTAIEFWPGLRRVGGDAACVVAEAEPPAATQVTVCPLPPRRTPTAFVVHFSFSGVGMPQADGVIRLTYAPGAHGRPTTGAELTLDVPGAPPTLVRTLRGRAAGFLANLARAAESRSDAA